MSKPEFDCLHKLVMCWCEVAEKIHTAKHLQSFGYGLLETEELCIILGADNIVIKPSCELWWWWRLVVYLVVWMNQDEEAGKYLRKDEEIAEKPALTGRGDGGEVTPQMVAVTLITSEGIKHLTMLPVYPGLILPTVRDFRDCPLRYYDLVNH